MEGENEIEVPPVTPGQKVAIQLKEPHYHVKDADGNWIKHWVKAPPEIKVVRDRDRCWNADWANWAESEEEAQHSMSICIECIPEWATDYYVELVDDDTPVTNPDMEF